MTCLYILIVCLLIQVNPSFQVSLLKSLIQRRQILDGTAKSGGVAPKPPGSDQVFNQNQFSNPTTIQPGQTHLTGSIAVTTTTTTTTRKSYDDESDERSIKDTVSSNSSSTGGLIASILAPTGIVGIVGAVVGALLYKKNHTNSSTSNGITGFFSHLFSSNTNATTENKCDTHYLPVGNIS